MESTEKSVEFEFTKDDFRRFNLFHMSRSPSYRRTFLLGWLLPPTIWLLICIALWRFADRDQNVLRLETFLAIWPLFSGVPLYLIAFPFVIRRYEAFVITAMANEGRNLAIFCRHRVSITPTHVSDATEYTVGNCAWLTVERIVLSGDAMYVYTSALSAIVVPYSAFPSTYFGEDFIESAQRYWREAQACRKSDDRSST